MKLLHKLYPAWYNDHSQEISEDIKAFTQKTDPRRDSRSPGVILCLLALAVTVKPLANVEADYTCYDSHQEISEEIQSAHLLSVARLEKGSGVILA